MLAVSGLTKVFGRRVAVDGVSFRVDKGAVVGLLGPNGSGKTTIMRTLTGYFPPTSGTAWVAGINVADDPLAARQRTGYLPESAVLYPELRVDQLLAFCADVRGLRGPSRAARLAAVKQACGLTAVERRLIGNLSKGYRQRVGLAQALLHEPEVLILDEPTVGLDPEQVIEIRDLICSLRGRSTVLLSTHILSEVSTVCERVVIIDRGRLVAEDTTAGLAQALQQDERTLLRVDGPPSEVAAALGAVAGVDGVERRDEAGSPAYVVHTHDGERARAALAAAVVARGWGLVEMRPIVMTLEELFVRLLHERRGEAGS
jgi:ABC-2 type transport system ATP-binding protein